MEVYLDDGRLLTPPSLTIPTLPSSTVEPVHRALARVLNPGIEFRDHLFGMGTQPLKPKSIELQVHLSSVYVQECCFKIDMYSYMYMKIV